MPICRRNPNFSRHHARTSKLQKSKLANFVATTLFAGAAATASLVATPAASAQSTSAAYSGVRFLTEVPILDCKGTPCIEVRIGDDATPLKFVIDTGNVDSIIDTKIMKS